MKSIGSFFMVAVLSLTLLHQPCMAADDKKESVSSVTQENACVVEKQTDKPSGLKIQAKAEASQSKASQMSVFYKRFAYYFLEILYLLTLFCALRSRYNDGFSKGFDQGRALEDERTLREGYRRGYRDSYRDCYDEMTRGKCPTEAFMGRLNLDYLCNNDQNRIKA